MIDSFETDLGRWRTTGVRSMDWAKQGLYSLKLDYPTSQWAQKLVMMPHEGIVTMKMWFKFSPFSSGIVILYRFEALPVHNFTQTLGPIVELQRTGANYELFWYDTAIHVVGTLLPNTDYCLKIIIDIDNSRFDIYCDTVDGSTLLASRCNFFGAGGAGYVNSIAGLSIFQELTISSIVDAGQIYFDLIDTQEAELPEPKYLATNTDNATWDNLSLLAVVGDNIYYASIIGVTPASYGHFFKYNKNTGAITTLATVEGLSVWPAIHNAADNKIWVGGAWIDAGNRRAFAGYIDLSNDSVHLYSIAGAGWQTTDCNEILSILDDGNNLILGEIATLSCAGGSTYPFGGGIWQIPKATINDPATYVRKYNQASQNLFWQMYLAKRGSTYFSYRLSDSAAGPGGYYIQTSTDLVNWTTVVDGMSSIPANTHLGNMIYIPSIDKIVAVGWNTDKSFKLHIYNGASWSVISLYPFSLSGVVGCWIGYNKDNYILKFLEASGFTSVGTMSIYQLDLSNGYTKLKHRFSGSEYYPRNHYIDNVVWLATSTQGHVLSYGINEDFPAITDVKSGVKYNYERETGSYAGGGGGNVWGTIR